MSGPFTEDLRLPPVGDVLRPWREFLAQHTNDATTGRCSVCQARDCERWQWAVERLAEAEAPGHDVIVPEAGMP